MAKRPWLRLHADLIHNPKLARLTDSQFRFWVHLLCVGSQNNGNLPPEDEIAFILRKSAANTRALLESLRLHRLLDVSETGIKLHDWDQWQFQSDVSTERVQQFRKRRGNVSETFQKHDETVPRARATDTETEQRQKQSRAENVSPTIDLAGFTERLYQTGQPGKRRNRTLAEQAICDAYQRGKIGESGVPMETVEARWIVINASEDWSWKGGAKAQTLAEWVTDGNYRYEAPPATTAVLSKREATNRAIEERLMRDFLEAQNG